MTIVESEWREQHCILHEGGPGIVQLATRWVPAQKGVAMFFDIAHFSQRKMGQTYRNVLLDG